MSSHSIPTFGHPDPPPHCRKATHKAFVDHLHESARSIEPQAKWYLPLKTAAEFAIALMLLVISSPVLMISAALIKLTSRGPVFYCQVRLGKDSRHFKLYKLRTMVHNAEALTGPVWSKPNDPRITGVGRFLRCTHLDEFSQLVNVLFGHMGLIGPRPERPEFVTHLEWQLPNYRDRFSVRPGITGLAQLLLPPDSDLESVRRKLVHDLYYVKNVGPSLDFRIALFTFYYLIRVLSSNCLRGLKLPSQDVIEQCIVLEMRSPSDRVDVIKPGFSDT